MPAYSDFRTNDANLHTREGNLKKNLNRQFFKYFLLKCTKTWKDNNTVITNRQHLKHFRETRVKFGMKYFAKIHFNIFRKQNFYNKNEDLQLRLHFQVLL